MPGPPAQARKREERKEEKKNKERIVIVASKQRIRDIMRKRLRRHFLRRPRYFPRIIYRGTALRALPPPPFHCERNVRWVSAREELLSSSSFLPSFRLRISFLVLSAALFIERGKSAQLFSTLRARHSIQLGLLNLILFCTRNCERYWITANGIHARTIAGMRPTDAATPVTKMHKPGLSSMAIHSLSFRLDAQKRVCENGSSSFCTSFATGLARDISAIESWFAESRKHQTDW